jgi:hypothetical protein
MAESPELEATADETDVVEETTEAPAPGVVQYLLRNVTRSRTNRTARVAVPGRIPFVQRLAGGRIIVRRARPARISEAVLKENLAEIAKLVDLHTIEVTTLDGKVVSLETFGVVKQAAPASPLPNPPLDSAKNDQNEGVGYNVPGSPEGTTLDSEEPELLRQSSLLVEEEEEPSEEEQHVIAPFVSEPDPEPAPVAVSEPAPEPAPETPADAPAPAEAAEEASEDDGEESDEEAGDDEADPEPGEAAPSAEPTTSTGAVPKKKKRRKGRK